MGWQAQAGGRTLICQSATGLSCLRSLRLLDRRANGLASLHCKGCMRCARPAVRRRIVRQSRGGLTVEANELNKWGDTDGRDEDAGGKNEDDLAFTAETSGIVLRVLTARAVQRILVQLQETDMFVMSWLHNYCQDHNPMTGDKFLLSLYSEKAEYKQDKTTKATHYVSPLLLANRILTVRESLAEALATSGFPMFVARKNLEVQRKYLEAQTYTSGTHGAWKTSEPGKEPRGR